MSPWKFVVVLCLSFASAACGPEIRFDEGAVQDIGVPEEPASDEAPTVLSSALPLEALPSPGQVQGRGEFSADIYDGRVGDLSALVFAAQPMLVIDANAEQTEAVFEDVSVGAASTRVSRRRLNDAELVEFANATGREYFLYDGDGYVCTATAADVWRVREEWAEPEDEDSGDAPAPSRELVAASLLPTEGDCGGALYATPAQGVQAFFVEVKEPVAPLSASAMKAFVGLGEYSEIQDDFARGTWQADAGEPVAERHGAWTDYSDSGSSVTQYTDETGRTLVRVAAWAGVGCGDFRADLWAVWERTRSGLSLRAVSQNGAGAAFFLERDGRLSYGTESQLHAASGNHWSQSFAPLEPWSCPC